MLKGAGGGESRGKKSKDETDEGMQSVYVHSDEGREPPSKLPKYLHSTGSHS